jgi:prolyl-tRNA editing enzyme YbaK/EbsC (Cys-tRNA(Pro) deacylase)
VIWPEPVERIASFLRSADVPGRLEELPAGVDRPPGQGAQALGFDCDGRRVVVLVPDEREADAERVARRAGCRTLRRSEAPAFPFQGARVFADRSLLPVRTVWLEAGTRRHFVGLAPAQLLRLVRAETGVFVAED